MIRKAFGLLIAGAFLASFAAPAGASVPSVPSHACCAGRAKKAPLAPCCRAIARTPALLTAAAPLPAPALASIFAFAVPIARVPIPAASPLVLVRSASPPGPTGLSPPPARVV